MDKIRVYLIQDSDKLFFYTYSFAKFLNQFEAFASTMRLSTKENSYIMKSLLLDPNEYEALVNSSPFANADNPTVAKKPKLSLVKEKV